MTQTVVGYFEDLPSANRAITRLHDIGYDDDHISVVTRKQDVDSVVGASETTSDDDDIAPGKGAMVGGITGLLAGVGATLIPGIGPVVAAGPLAAAIGTGVGAATGAAAGPMISAFMDKGVPEGDASRYAEGIKKGGTVVMVEAEDDEGAEVEATLDACGAVEVEHERGRMEGTASTDYAAPKSRSRVRNVDASSTDMSTGDTRAMDTEPERVARDTQQVRVPVVEESIDIGKREVQKVTKEPPQSENPMGTPRR